MNPTENQRVIDEICMEWLDTSEDTVSAPMRFRLKQIIGEQKLQIQGMENAQVIHARVYMEQTDRHNKQLEESNRQIVELRDQVAVRDALERQRMFRLKESNRLYSEARNLLGEILEMCQHTALFNKLETGRKIKAFFGDTVPTPEVKRNEVLTYPMEKCERCGREHKLAGVPCPCRFA